jgi:CheY-like chemotaxis protein
MHPKVLADAAGGRWNHVDTVSSGKEAIARINKGERPDFIILDVLMAEMNGLETLQELMRLDRSLNVIMAACSNEPSTIAEALRLGARNYLVSGAKLKFPHENRLARDFPSRVSCIFPLSSMYV